MQKSLKLRRIMDAAESLGTTASEERLRFLALLKRHGWNATSFQALEAAFLYWFADDDAGVAYIDTGSAWVAAGAPIASEDRLHSVAEAFVQAAAQRKRRVSFFAAEARFAHLPSLTSVQVGEQPEWIPSRWAVELQSSRSMREQLRRARAKNVQIRKVERSELEHPDSPVKRSLTLLIQRWLQSRPMAPMGFLVQIELFSFSTERWLFVAEQEGRIIGLLNAVPVYARRGWLLEDVLRDPQAPNGTTELLVDTAMRAANEAQAEYVTMGLVPLAGAIPRWLRRARTLGSPLYDFEGLRAFKAKHRPVRWSPIYLSYPSSSHAGAALFDVLQAFARGNLLRFGLETVMRGPSWVVRVLALALVPWTLMLALASAEQWFPSPGVKWAWVAFDVALTVALVRLSLHWRQRLATLLAALITVDAGLTLLQALCFNLPRAHSFAGWVVPWVATLAPSIAALLLWSGRAHRTTDAPGED